uniref:NADH-ubiquinone oxidoreductase chain 4L n=1 Tax=Brachiopoda sp. TaxID=3230945 RepID=A0AAU8HN13_9BILA
MLNLLICLETLMLSLIFLALTSLVSYAEPYMILSFLVLGACEASVGLALLVSFLRSQSKETMKTTAASLW